MKKLLLIGVLFIVALLVIMRRVHRPMASMEAQSPTNAVPVSASNDGAFASPSGPASNQPRIAQPGVGKQNKSPDSRLADAVRNYVEQMRADPLYQFKIPMLFYGKILDENEKPVPDADIAFEWNNLNISNVLERATSAAKSDMEGKFSFYGQNGGRLFVTPRKAGYYSPKQNPLAFEYANPGNAAYYIPDSQNPVVFHIRKRGAPEPLVTGEKLFGFKPDGSRYYVNLLTGKKSSDPSAEWDVSVQFSRSEANADRKYDWSVALDGSNGGISETNGEFAFLAPVAGYKPIQISQKASDPEWKGGGTYQFFVKSRDGKIYSRVEAQFLPGYNENAAINMKYYVNPAGSRNLEFDPTQ